MNNHLLFNKKGFTLIELIIAMAILAIISSFLLGGFLSSQKKARDAQRKSDLKQIQNALEAYANDHNGLYPNDDSGEIDGAPWGSEFHNPDHSETIYIKKLPEDPGSVDYYYQQTQSGAGYRLYACLENNQDSDYYEYTDTTCSGCGENDYCTYGVASSNEEL